MSQDLPIVYKTMINPLTALSTTPVMLTRPWGLPTKFLSYVHLSLSRSLVSLIVALHFSPIWSSVKMFVKSTNNEASNYSIVSGLLFLPLSRLEYSFQCPVIRRPLTFVTFYPCREQQVKLPYLSSSSLHVARNEANFDFKYSLSLFQGLPRPQIDIDLYCRISFQ
jgi:hypothetical protein